MVHDLPEELDLLPAAGDRLRALAPALLLIGVFFAIPVLGAFVLSFTDFDIYSVGDISKTRFIGLANYSALMDNPLFWTATRNTLYFVMIGGPPTISMTSAPPT